MTLKIAIAGVGGRMGRAVLNAGLAAGDVAVVAGVDRPELVGSSLASLANNENAAALADAVVGDLKTALAAGPQCLIDFSLPAACKEHVAAARDAACPIVIGVTGFDDPQLEMIEGAAAKTPVLLSGNMSLGVNLLVGLVRQAAAHLPAQDFDIEIIETHHKRKVDAPSGTAIMLGRGAAEGRGVAFDPAIDPSRAGARSEGALGFAVVRGGGVIGDHTVAFLGENERIELTHKAIDRGLFADGALAAARWLASKPPGLYSMQDVLGIGGQPA